MKHTFQIPLFMLALVMALTACGPSSTPTSLPPVLLDAPDASTSSLVKASGVVVPIKEARLSFVISGMVEDVTVKEGDQVQAGQELVRLDTTELEYDIVTAKAALTSVEIDAKLARMRDKQYNVLKQKFIQISPPGEQIEAADARVEQSQHALEAAEAAIAQGTLMAPIDSTVIAVNVMPGEYVQTAQVVIELADLNHLQIETTDLSELNVPAVKIGQPATVFVEALNENFPGKVIAISPIADTIGGDVVFKVTVELDEQPKSLLWGMSADVEINVK